MYSGTPTCFAQAAAKGNRPNQRSNSAAWLSHKAVVHAQGPDVAGKDGCLA